jgi:integrase
MVKKSNLNLNLNSKSIETSLIPWEINEATLGIPNCFKNMILTLRNQDNALTIARFILATKNEINLSDSYRKSLISNLSILSKFCDSKPFSEMTREDVQDYLNSLRKTDEKDPLHKWIGTYNHYLVVFSKFFKWLNYPDLPSKEREKQKPSVINNFTQLKRKETSIYKPSDLWSQEDDQLFLKYCPSVRERCYHTISRDMGCRPSEILRLRIKDVVFKMVGDRQYAEVLANGKSGSRPLPLINSIPYYKDWIDVHPQRTNPNAYLIYGKGKSYGRKLTSDAMYSIYADFKNKFFPKLLQDPSVSPEDKVKIKELLKKPWNPYIRRHSALTAKSQILKENVLRQYAGWSMGSNMHLKYIHYFGNESNESILEAYGLKTKFEEIDKMKPRQCPNCSEINKIDSKFCVKCRMVLSYDAYTETIQDNNKFKDEISQLKYQHEKQMEGMGQQIDRLESTVSKVFSKISGGLNQLTGIESIDKKLMKKYAFDPDKII